MMQRSKNFSVNLKLPCTVLRTTDSVIFISTAPIKYIECVFDFICKDLVELRGKHAKLEKRRNYTSTVGFKPTS